ncbi:hypothetical protein JCM9279_001844 [Rhodotorula babjevae]
MTSSSRRRRSPPPTYSAVEGARFWNHQVSELRRTKADCEIVRRDHLVHASQQLARATVFQQEEIWARQWSGRESRVRQRLLDAVWQRRDATSISLATANSDVERRAADVDRLSSEAHRRDKKWRITSAFLRSRSRPLPDILAELNEACHTLGNAKGFAAYYDALLTGYKTFSDHLGRAMRGEETYNPPPAYDDADRAERLSVYGESPPEYDVRYVIRQPHEDPTTSPAAGHDDEEDVDDDWGYHSWSSLPSLRDWDGEFRHQLPPIEELTSPQERQELTRLDIDPLHALRRPSATEDGDDYVHQVADWRPRPPERYIPRPREERRTVQFQLTQASRRHGGSFE